MKLVGWQRGADKSTTGWVQANWRYPGQGSIGDMLFWVEGSGVEIAEAPLIPHTFYDGTYHADHGYTVQSTPAMTTYRHYSTSSDATADYPALPTGYEYRAGNGLKSVLARVTSSRSDGLLRFYHEPAWINQQIRATMLPYSGARAYYTGQGYTYLFGPRDAPENVAVSYRHFLDAPTPSQSGGTVAIYNGRLGSIMGEAAIYEPDTTNLVIGDLWPSGFQSYSWNSWAYDIDNVYPEDIRIAFQPWVDPWVQEELDQLPLAFDRVYTTRRYETYPGVPNPWPYPFPAGDYWMRVSFEIYIYQWMPVYGPNDGTWPPTDPPEDTSGESTYITRARPDILYRAYEVDPNVVVERNTRIDTLEWSSVITPFAGQHPCVAQDVSGTPWVLYTDGTNVKRRNVLTGAEANMASGKRPFERWSPGWAFRVLTYWRVTGAGPNGVSYFMRYDASGAVMTAETALVSDVPEQAVSVDWQANGTLTALYSDGTNIHTLTSTDNGATWA